MDALRPIVTAALAKASTFCSDPAGLAAIIILAALACLRLYWETTKRRVYLLDVACYRAPPSLQMPRIEIAYRIDRHVKRFLHPGESEGVAFLNRIGERNGLGEGTVLPSGLHSEPVKKDMETARQESMMALFGATEEVLQRTGLNPRDISILIVNCSLFNPTPSLSAMVINRFKMRSSIQSYNLAGMGCSAGIIAVDLARRLLNETPNGYALVLSTENTTQNWYPGKERGMLIPNALFRMGAAAIVLTNKPHERRRAKYELEHVVRVHLGADSTAYKCVFQREDQEGVLGVALTKDIVRVAARALQMNLTTLAPRVLPYTELIKYGVDFALRKMGRRAGPPYQPDFRTAFQHFSLHAGGRGVIEGLGGELKLTKENLEPSFSSLYFFGNTSSASYWYGFTFSESKHGMRKGDRIWQVGFGSGFKTNSAVWRALRTFKDPRHRAWADVSEADVAKMWRDLAEMGVRFVDGVMPLPQMPSKKQAKGVQPQKETDGEPLPKENGGEPLPKENGGHPLPAENGGKLLSKENGGKPLTKEDDGKSIPVKNGGELVPKENGLEPLPRENRGNSMPKENGGEPFAKENGGERVPNGRANGVVAKVAVPNGKIKASPLDGKVFERRAAA